VKQANSRRLLLPLVPLYAGVIAVKSWMFRRGWLSQRHLRHSVMSVGSLSAGGAGKTPVVLMLAELLGERGFEVRILTRGYGRSSKTIERVDPNGDPARFGDEPLLLARRATTASVWVGADRYQAGVLSQRGDSASAKVVYLLDDGFQHRKLARDVDVLLLTRQDISDSLLPAGNLREPLQAVERADLILLREEEADLAKEVVARLATKRPIMTIRRRLRFQDEMARPHRPLAFCGLARPEGFLAMLAAEGILPIATSIFRDHHPYAASDIEELLKIAASHGADSFVTTEKDAVKLSPAMIERLETFGPLVVPALEVELTNEQAGMDALLAVLAERFGKDA
jgi:tetraacyldisaccharide 4'-kinase